MSPEAFQVYLALVIYLDANSASGKVIQAILIQIPAFLQNMVGCIYMSAHMGSKSKGSFMEAGILVICKNRNLGSRRTWKYTDVGMDDMGKIYKAQISQCLHLENKKPPRQNVTMVDYF